MSLAIRREQLYSDAFSELASPDVGGCGYMHNFIYRIELALQNQPFYLQKFCLFENKNYHQHSSSGATLYQ